MGDFDWDGLKDGCDEGSLVVEGDRLGSVDGASEFDGPSVG